MVRIVTAESALIENEVHALLVRTDVRYRLAAGTGAHARPLWSFGARPGSPGPVAMRVLSSAEDRQAAIEREIASLAAADGLVVTEVIGTPSADDVRFWQACRTRLPHGLVVLRHEAAPPDRPFDQHDEEVLLTLLLCGGYAWSPEFEGWATARGWNLRHLNRVVSRRECAEGVLYTYAGARDWSRAGAIRAAADPELLADLASMVVATQPDPLVATAAHLANPSFALAAGARLGFADSPDAITSYARTLFRNARKTRIPRADTAAVYLAALAVGRVSEATARLILQAAQRNEVDVAVQAQLACQLGQSLAKANNAEASIRCFDHARRCLESAMDPEVAGSGTAAAHNGAALARYRTGDRGGAVRAELAALAELTAPGVADQGHLVEQQVLLLTNLAAVSPSPVSHYWQAWRLASEADSLPAMAYVAPGLVRAVGDADVVRRLLDRYDAAPIPPKSVERAVVACCFALADKALSSGDIAGAADWYVDAVRRMHRAGPAVITAIMRNLSGHGNPPADAMSSLAEQLHLHEVMAADLSTLLGLLEPADA